MDDYKAIETEYKGYRFRSRLEARWAVFFDELGIEWQYEIEGFEREWAGVKYKYLPDFYLPAFEVYVEVKGTDTALNHDADKIAHMIDWDGPLANGLLILGNIPDPTQIGFANIPLFSFLYCDSGLIKTYASFVAGPYYNQFVLETGSKLFEHIFCRSKEWFESCNCDSGLPDTTSTKNAWSKQQYASRIHLKNKSLQMIQAAYKTARSARFEFGEEPKRNQELNLGSISTFSFLHDITGGAYE